MLIVKKEGSRAAKHPAFSYQVEAVEAIKGLEYAAVFHEQGLGKTKIAIDLALTWLQGSVVDSILFVTKKALVHNWQHEIRDHSFLNPRILDQNRQANFFAFNSPARVYLTHYEVCKAENARLKLFLKTRRVGVICDEAQKLKNPESEIAKALFQLSPLFVRRVIMTGTPIANRPYDIWAPVFFLDSGIALGKDFAAFKRQHDIGSEVAHDSERRARFEDDLSSLYGKLEGFCIRETKATAGISLPSKHIASIVVDAEERQEEIYRNFRDDLRSVVMKGAVPILDCADDVLKLLLRLVQVASNPGLVDDSYTRQPAKLPELKSLLDSALEDPNTKAIVWTSFTENVDWLTRQLHALGAVKVHGKLAIKDRNSALERFKSNPSARVLVATPGAAKEGLTLTVANVAIFYDRSFSLDDYLQAQDRIHRISQLRPCYVYNLIMRDTVDEWVDELLGAKHLAAKLGLGDMSREEYETQSTYSFAETLQRVLGRVLEGES